MKPNTAKIAFVGWNPFQLIYVSELIRNIPNSTFILENKHNNISQFDKTLLTQTDIPIEVYDSKDIHKIDNIYHIIVCQTIFTNINKIKKAKIAMIQYGYAKEAHNYGDWRSLADVCFTYGPYASKRISQYCPTIEIGFLRHNQIQDNNFKKLALLKYSHLLQENKKTILYVPTWGDLSSKKKYLKKIESLRKDYNVLIKIHHNTDLLKFKHKFRNNDKNVNLGANDDLLHLITISDLVISDFSGAIFDTIYCKKPLILVDNFSSNHTSHDNELKSIEYQKRKELGLIVNSPEYLEESIKEAFCGKHIEVSSNLFYELFSKQKNAHQIIINTLKTLLIAKDNKLTEEQLIVREEVKIKCQDKYASIKYRFLNNVSSIYSKIIGKK